MARIDTLTNFLTDVADSIRSKTGKSETIACEDFDTEIESISGGGEPNLQTKSVTITENGTTNITADSGYDGLEQVNVTTNVSQSIPTIRNATELIYYSNIVFQSFANYLKNIKNNYGVYTENSITLYSPYEGAENYVIHKRSSGKYRIVWSQHLDIISFESETLYYFYGIHVLKPTTNANDNYIIRNDLSYDLETFKNRILDLEIRAGSTGAIAGPGSYDPRRFWFSNEFDTIEELIAEVTSPTGNITYSFWNTGYSFGGVKDTEYDFNYTNCNIMDYNTGEFLNGKILSHNETILVKS